MFYYRVYHNGKRIVSIPLAGKWSETENADDHQNQSIDQVSFHPLSGEVV